MDMEAQVAEAIRTELERQAGQVPDLSVDGGDGALTIHGRVDLEALAMVVVGTVAGGP